MNLTEIQVFDFNQHPVRTFGTPAEPWFAAADVCNVLNIANSSDAISRLDEDQKGVGITDPLSSGGSQQVATVDESGLYTLLFRSRKPQAKAFCRWVTREVLPAIRKTGRYEAAGAPMRDAKPIRAGDYQLARIIANAVADKGPIQGTPTRVFKVLNKLCAGDVAQSEMDWPDNPIRFGRALKRVDTALRDFEVTVTRHRSGTGRLVRLETGVQQSGPLALPSLAQLEDSVARLAATLAQMKANQ